MKLSKITVGNITLEGEGLETLLLNECDELTTLLAELAPYAVATFPATVAKVGRVGVDSGETSDEESRLRELFKEREGMQFTSRGRCEKENALAWLQQWERMQGEGAPTENGKAVGDEESVF